MALKGYLSVPDIEGESQAAEHEGAIEVWGVEWGIDGNAATSSRRFGRTRARTDMTPLGLFKMWDKSSVYLAEACKTGKRFDEVVVSFRKDSGEAHLDYLVITMTNAYIVDYEMHHRDFEEDDQRIRERFTLEYQDITLLHTEQSDDGTAGTEHEVELSDKNFGA